MSETEDPMIEAAAALAEYEEKLVFGDPEENHARLAAAVRAIVAVRSEPSDAQVVAAWDAFYTSDDHNGGYAAMRDALRAAMAAS